ncbi:hypothetical protein [Bacillus sp. CGMCC 1.16541]|uniref:hypothetical protein n=1 Tax=Bacillus sp. CGMCC 1.16541 TaxID=2185143 RepID=UPI00194E085C|nr:hypothetical protein [Bacillus sp. CGMCC 1.16541]
MKKIPTQRIDIRFPTALLEKVEEYQYEHAISTRTAAMLDLIRKGLEANKKE